MYLKGLGQVFFYERGWSFGAISLLSLFHSYAFCSGRVATDCSPYTKAFLWQQGTLTYAYFLSANLFNDGALASRGLWEICFLSSDYSALLYLSFVFQFLFRNGILTERCLMFQRVTMCFYGIIIAFFPNGLFPPCVLSFVFNRKHCMSWLPRQFGNGLSYRSLWLDCAPRTLPPELSETAIIAYYTCTWSRTSCSGLVPSISNNGYERYLSVILPLSHCRSPPYLLG